MSSALSELAPTTKQKWWRPFTKPILSSFDNHLNPPSSIQNLSFNDSDPANLNLQHLPPKVFGSRLEDSLRVASVAISMVGQDHKAYIYGFIPVVVAKCGLYLKQDATLVQGIFRISGSTKRMKELQSIFDQPPFYGKDLDWSHHHPYPIIPHHPSRSDPEHPSEAHHFKPYFSIHDAANVLRRYLMCLPEPLISQSMYEDLKEVLLQYRHDQPTQIKLFKSLISTLSSPSQYLLLYLLDLLAVFANRSDKNLMTANNLAVVFQPALCPANPTTSAKLNRIIYAQRQPKPNPPTRTDPQQPSPHPVQLDIQQESLREQESIMKEVKQAQAVVEFMIHHQNHFVVGLRPQIKPARPSNQARNHENLELKLDDKPKHDEHRDEEQIDQPASTPRPTSRQSGLPRPTSCQDHSVGSPVPSSVSPTDPEPVSQIEKTT